MAPTVSEYFAEKHVLLTGVTGFVGKCLMEKLLRSCPNIGKIYLLVRPKKGQSSDERMKSLLKSEIFSRLSKCRDKYFFKLVLLPGDITLPNFGLNPNDLKIIQNNVEIFLHPAACIALDLPVHVALKKNLGGTKYALDLAVQMGKLEAFIYVSSTFCLLPSTDMEEVVFPTEIHPEELLHMIEIMPEQWRNNIPKDALEGRICTYSYSKHMSEKLVETYASKIPVCIIRPGGILAAYEEPFPGWLDHNSTLSKYFKSIFNGEYYCVNIDPALQFPLVPVDFVVNLMIAAAWRLGASSTRKFLVYNNAICQLNKDLITIGAKEFRKNPPADLYFYPNALCEKSPAVYKFKNRIFRFIPLLILDIILRRSKQNKRGTYEELQVYNQIFYKSWLSEWCLEHRRNSKALHFEMCEKDRQIFPLQLDSLDCEEFIRRFAKGINLYGSNKGKTASCVRLPLLKLADIGMKFGMLMILLLPLIIALFYIIDW